MTSRIAKVTPVRLGAPKPEAANNPFRAGDRLIDDLENLPHRIQEAQGDFDEAERAYKAQLAMISIAALSKPLFPGKKDSDPLRPAANDSERELAIQQAVAGDEHLIELARDRETALRILQRERNRFEAAKLIAQLMISSK